MWTRKVPVYILLYLASIASSLIAISPQETQLSPYLKRKQNFSNGMGTSRRPTNKRERRFSPNLLWRFSPTQTPIIPERKENATDLQAQYLNINFNTTFSSLEKKAQHLSFFQSLLRNIATSRVEEELAEMSSNWANVAQSVVADRYGEVIQLTRKTHEAQLLYLQKAAIAHLLSAAVSKAKRVQQSSILRFQTLQEAAESGKHILSGISNAGSLVQEIYSVREKWAQEERARAIRLSTKHLKKVLEELRLTTLFAQTAHSVVVDMK